MNFLLFQVLLPLSLLSCRRSFFYRGHLLVPLLWADWPLITLLIGSLLNVTQMNVCPADIDAWLAAVCCCCCYLSAWPPCWRGQDPLNVFFYIFHISHPISVALGSTLPRLFSNKPAKWEVDWINGSWDTWRTDRQIVVRIVSSLTQHRRCERHPAYSFHSCSHYSSCSTFTWAQWRGKQTSCCCGCATFCAFICFSWKNPTDVKQEVNVRFIVNSW